MNSSASSVGALSFNPSINNVSIPSFGRQHWKWRNAPDWKNERLRIIQDMLYAKGFTKEEVYAVSLMAIQESGLNFNALGDNGCSEGIWQRNRCVHGHNPYDFNTVEGNVEYIAQRMRVYFNRYPGNIKRAVQAHNSPARAASHTWNNYINEVYRHTSSLIPA